MKKAGKTVAWKWGWTAVFAAGLWFGLQGPSPLQAQTYYELQPDGTLKEAEGGGSAYVAPRSAQEYGGVHYPADGTYPALPQPPSYQNGPTYAPMQGVQGGTGMVQVGERTVPGYLMEDGSVVVTEPPPQAPQQYSVLVGSYRAQRNADVATQRVKSMGFNAYWDQRLVNNTRFVRVYAGPFVDYQSARNAYTHLITYLNFSGAIVPFHRR